MGVLQLLAEESTKSSATGLRTAAPDLSRRWSSDCISRIDLGGNVSFQSVADAAPDERQEMEHRILVAAASLFNRKGFAGATTRELAQSLGLQRASLYHYLESKQDLLYAICVGSLQIAAREFAEAVAAATLENRLRDAIRAHIAAMARDQDMHAVMHDGTAQPRCRATGRGQEAAGGLRGPVA